MKKAFFDTVEEFVEYLTERYDVIINKDADVSIIAKYEEARKIIKSLMFEDWNLRHIELYDVSYNNYDDEFVISLSSIDEDYEVWCEPMKKDFGYIFNDSTEVYVLDNCSSKVLSYCTGVRNFELTIGELCGSMCNNECCGCCNCEEHNSDMSGFSVNHSDEDGYCSYSFYSTNKDLVNELARLFK